MNGQEYSSVINNNNGAKKNARSWGQWIEPWYLIYGLLGISIAGLAPILLPVEVSRTGGATEIGLVMAVFNLGGLTAPVWGYLADEHRLHRFLVIGGLILTVVGLVFFPFTSSLVGWVGFALMQGIGSASTATVANLFIVETHPPAEWDVRIGWLQSFYGGGQVIGLLLAGWLGQLSLTTGLLLAAFFAVVGAFSAPLITHIPDLQPGKRPILTHPSRQSEWPPGSPQRLYHHYTLASLKKLGSIFLSAKGLFLIAWLFSFGGTAALFALYPVLMQHLYHIQSSLSSVGFAVAAGLGLAFYTPAGQWAKRLGASRVLRTGLAVRLIAFVGLLGLSMTYFGQGWAALFLFLFIVVAWSLLSVSGTTLAAQLSSIGEGEGLGIFNGTTALAGVLGSILGGWIANQFGYQSVIIFGLLGILFGLIITFALNPVQKASMEKTLADQ